MDTTKPCRKCGRMMHHVPASRKYCDCCRYGYPPEPEPEKKTKKGPSLREIMHEADKEGLQYASYCKKHGLY